MTTCLTWFRSGLNSYFQSVFPSTSDRCFSVPTVGCEHSTQGGGIFFDLPLRVGNWRRIFLGSGSFGCLRLFGGLFWSLCLIKPGLGERFAEFGNFMHALVNDYNLGWIFFWIAYLCCFFSPNGRGWHIHLSKPLLLAFGQPHRRSKHAHLLSTCFFIGLANHLAYFWRVLYWLLSNISLNVPFDLSLDSRLYFLGPLWHPILGGGSLWHSGNSPATSVSPYFPFFPQFMCSPISVINRTEYFPNSEFFLTDNWPLTFIYYFLPLPDTCLVMFCHVQKKYLTIVNFSSLN